MGRYDDVLLEIFMTKYDPRKNEISFTKQEIAKIAEKHGIRNVPDIFYYYAFDRGTIPDAIMSKGFISLNITGRGTYSLSKKPMIVTIPEIRKFEEIKIQLPQCVERFVSDDEQGILIRILYGDVLSKFLGKRIMFLQGFLRTNSIFGQTEVDALYVSEDEEICTVEAKGPGESLNKNQIIRQVEGTKCKFGVESVIPLAIKFFRDHRIIVIRFNKDYDIANFAGYRLIDTI